MLLRTVAVAVCQAADRGPGWATHSFSATDWAHAGTTLALWLAIPLIIGGWRFARRDVD